VGAANAEYMKRVAALSLVVLVLAACAKNGESSSSSSASPSAAPSTSSAVAQNGAEASDGAKVYQTNCASCHQASGQGVPGSFPPLAGNPEVVGDVTTVIHDVKYGLSGKVTVAGQDYNGMMPAWGQQLSNADIAAVITYIRASWGNKASAVSEGDVSVVSQ
jgi:mono/diheme cytochrome c family protein